MDRYKIPKEYEECTRNIEEKTGKHLSPYLAQSILREANENTETENPILYANKFMDELKEKSFYFIKEVTRNMIIEAEMYCELKP